MKPEITKEQAEAIEFLKAGHGESEILKMYVDDSIGLMINMFGHDCGSIYDLSLIELAAALINGYEIGISPEESLHEYYVEALHTARDEVTGHDIQDAIRYTLETLGIKIEGVNA
ncbi:hypothetical protein [Bacillus sp. FSL P2-0092]|uniref:hypothetical protein n=1 Tax=Bacillus sp. FSL P2-0092 TaxID=2921571 RepID=UPI0030F7B681